MSRKPLCLTVGLLFVLIHPAFADEWPVLRGPSREPEPYRYDPKIVWAIPKAFLDDASACVLYSGTTHLIEPDGTVAMIAHEITRLNSRKGIEKLGEFRSISYDPAFQQLTLNEARIIKANGRFVAIEPKHVQLRDVATDFQVYEQDKQLVISFPNLEVGDAYEVKWTVRGKDREFDGEFFSRYTFGDDHHPVLFDEFRVGVPKNKTLKYATVNGQLEPNITSWNGGKLYRWSAKNRPELPRDDDRPSKEELRLQVAVSTFPSWEAVGAWKHKLRAECWHCTPEVRQVIAKVTHGLTTQEEKAKALTYWVRRRIRYLSRGPGGLGYTPHLPQQVLANLYGDCKDQAQLLAVMLREIGLPVWLVTLGTLDDGQVLPAVPSPWGSHAILRTKIDGKDHWIDTTVALASWDFLPRADRDRQVYLTQEKTLTLAKTPPFTYRDYRIEQTTHVTLRTDGTSHCRREAIYFGSAAWTRRDKWLEVPPGERRRAAAAELQDSHSKAHLLALKIDDKALHDFDQPVRGEMEFEIPKHFTGETNREGSFTDSPVWSWLLGYNLDLERDLPFQLPTPFESIHRYLIEIPVGYRIETMPEERTVRSNWGFFELKVTPDVKDARRLELHMHLRLEKNRVEKADFATFVQFQDEVSRAYRVWLNLRPASTLADAPELEKYLAQGKPGEVQPVKILAKIYLDHEKLPEARRLLEQGTAWFPAEKTLWELRVQAAKDVQEEERLYRTMVKQFPHEPKYALALGTAWVRREDHAEAEKILTPLTKDGTAAIRASAHYQLARAAYAQHHDAVALKHLQAALLQDSSSLATIEALHFKARVHEKLGQPQEAIHALQTALEADPSARDVLKYLVRLEISTGEREAALDYLRRYTVAAGKDLASLASAADLHYELNRFDDALELAERAGTIGFHVDVQRVLGLVHLRRHEYEQAVFYLERADLNGKALEGLIQAHLHLGELDRAEKLTELQKADAELGKEVTRLVERQGKLMTQWPIPAEQKAAAIRVVERLVCAEWGLARHWRSEELHRLVQEASAEGMRFGPLLALCGWLALEKGKLRQAAQDADAAIKMQPVEARAYLVRGRVWLEQGKSAEALRDLRRATELSHSKDAQVLHWLAAALLDAGKTREAVETQRLALLLRPHDVELRAQLQRMERHK